MALRLTSSLTKPVENHKPTVLHLKNAVVARVLGSRPMPLCV
jgi:hypothetical protein